MAKKDNTRDYNGRILNEDEVLVQIPYDELYAKENITNPDCIGKLTKAGKSIRTMSVAVPKDCEKLAKAQLNFVQNEELGHYQKKDTDYVDWDQDEVAQASYTTPSAEDIYFAEAPDDENVINFKRRMDNIIEKAPRVGYAMLIMMEDPSLKGDRFYAKMRLGKSEASEVKKEAEKYLKTVLRRKDAKVEKTNAGKRDGYYRSEAYRLLDIVAEKFR